MHIISTLLALNIIEFLLGEDIVDNIQISLYAYNLNVNSQFKPKY